MTKKTYIANDLLRDARDQKRLTQQKLADKIGTTALNIGRWEGGKVFPSAYYRRKLCEFFGKSSDEELGLIRERYRTTDEQEEVITTQPVLDTEPEEIHPVSPLVPLTQENPEEKPFVSLPTTPSLSNASKKRAWLLPLIITWGVLLVVVGFVIIPRVWSTNPNPLVDIAATATAETVACAATPTLIEPVDGQTLNSRTVTFAWEAPPGCVPDGYTVRITKNYDHETRPWIVDVGWAPTYYKYTFAEDGAYYWHIRACKPCTPFNPGRWITRILTVHT